MASNPSMFQEIGMEAMNNGYFMAGNIVGGSGLMSADVTPFHPSMLFEHGSSLGFGLGPGAAVTATELRAQFAASTVTLASLGDHHLSATAAARPQDERLCARMASPEEEMSCGFDVPGRGDGTAVWLPSSKAPYSVWSSASASDRPRAGSVHEPSHLGGIPDAAGFRYPVASSGGDGSGPRATATSELSLTLCSQSSSDSVLHTADQCSSAASRSALTTGLPQGSYPRAPRSAPAPFAMVVARSRYAAVAQEILNDVVGRLLDGVSTESGSSGGVDSGAGPSSSNRLMASSSEDAGARWGQAQRVRTDLVNMLEMLDQKYNRCVDEIRSTTAKFNGLMPHGGGVGNDSIRAPFAHRAVSAMYLGLKRRIAGEMMMTASRPACWGESSSATAGDMERSWESALIQKHWQVATQKARRGAQQVWRPQRGLPERSVAVLKAWMFEHFLKPYPDDHEKDVLAIRSGLSRNQVSNWFINARVRIWKPMIEEMYQDLRRSSAGDQGMEMGPQLNMMSQAVLLEGGP